jgi:MAF protein
MNPLNIILASGSPRRQAFLKELGLSFDIITASVDETMLPNERPVQMVVRLAEHKAQAVAQMLPAEQHPALIIAADTVVAIDHWILGKPRDSEDAIRILQKLRQRDHTVHSAVSVLHTGSGQQLTRVNSTRVRMRAYTDDEIRAYVATGDSLDKAGAYAIQHREFSPVERVEGCAAGVMGMPLADLRDLLASFGVSIPQPIAPVCVRQTGLQCCLELRQPGKD